MLDRLALALLIVGGVNWGLVGLFRLDVIAWMFGGSTSIIARALYILVALAAVWSISLFFKSSRAVGSDA